MAKYYSHLELAAGVKIGSNDEVTIEMGQPSDTYAGVDAVLASKQNFHVIVDSDNSDNQIGGFTIRSGGLTVDTSTELLKVAPDGKITVKSAYTLPTVDGTSGQQLTTDGAGQLSWAAPSQASFTTFKYTKELHVSPDLGNDTTGDGSYEKPYATISKVKTVVGNVNAYAIYLHTGTYPENITWDVGNTDIVALVDGGTVNVTGNWTFSHSSPGSVRVWNGGWNGAINITGSGPTFFTSANLNGAVTKSGSGFVELRLAAEINAATSSLTITGAGAFNMYGGAANFVTINNANAQFVARGGTNIAVINLQAGVALIDGAFVYSATATSSAVTSAAGSFFYSYNSRFITSTGTMARCSLAGFWSLNDTAYDKTNSTLTGTNFGTISHFDTINTHGYVVTTPKTVATLGSAATAGRGARSFVSDANATTFATAVAGGGSNSVPVYSNGTTWMIG